jgi:uncharacterized RDD family membrane protein YckC
MKRRALFLRRVAAYMIDYAVIASYAALLAVITLTLAPDPQLSKWQAYLLSVLTLTGPVIVAFALLEARFGASPGKVLFGLRVRRHRERAGFGRSLARNIGKFLPWEIAHIGIWTIPGQPFIDPPTSVNWTLWAASGGLVLIQIGLVAVTGRGLHDRLAGLRVEPR